MESFDKDNPQLEPPDIFSAMNHYVLLFFGFACILTSVFIQQLFFAMDQLRLGLVVAPFVGVILPAYAITRRFPLGFRAQFLFRRPAVITTLYVVVATLAVVVIVDYIYSLTQRWMSVPEDYVEGLKELRPEGMIAMAATFLGICVLAPLAEEIVFRGIIQRIFARNMGDITAMVLAGIFFGAIHLTPQLLFSMIAFGIFLGFLFFATSNLTYPVLAHCLLNSISYVQLVTLEDEELVSSPPYADNYWILLASVFVLVYLLVRIRKGTLVSTKAPHDRPKEPDGF